MQNFADFTLQYMKNTKVHTLTIIHTSSVKLLIHLYNMTASFSVQTLESLFPMKHGYMKPSCGLNIICVILFCAKASAKCIHEM